MLLNGLLPWHITHLVGVHQFTKSPPIEASSSPNSSARASFREPVHSQTCNFQYFVPAEKKNPVRPSPAKDRGSTSFSTCIHHHFPSLSRAGVLCVSCLFKVDTHKGPTGGRNSRVETSLSPAVRSQHHELASILKHFRSSLRLPGTFLPAARRRKHQESKNLIEHWKPESFFSSTLHLFSCPQLPTPPGHAAVR